jgi:hypothetical protein
MVRTYTTSSGRARHGGLTLVEVVAGIAILGSVLVGVVLAKSRHTRQLALAQRRQAAVRAADSLINEWWTGSEGIPVNESGAVPSAPSLVWETRIVDNRDVERLGARVVRVELRESESSTYREDADRPLVTVELVLPMPPPPGDRATRRPR